MVDLSIWDITGWLWVRPSDRTNRFATLGSYTVHLFTILYGFTRMYAQSLQSCLTLCNPLSCSSPGFSVHGILQSRILEWVVMPFSRWPFQPRKGTHISCIDGRFFTAEPWENPLPVLGLDYSQATMPIVSFFNSLHLQSIHHYFHQFFTLNFPEIFS